MDQQVILREQRFFDQEAGGLTTDESLLIPPDQFERYSRARFNPLNYPKDTLFAQLIPLKGKQVLDYGCGHGENACLLAALGAEVTAFDLSPLSIAKARRRAELHGLAERIHFSVCAAGELPYPSASFDLVTGFAILHHLHLILEPVYHEIRRLLKPKGKAYFIEPISNSPFLRWMRHCIPVKPDATHDERQLFDKDFEPLKKYFSCVEYHYSYCTDRMGFALGSGVSRYLRWADYHLQRLFPFVRRYYGKVLVIAHQ
jgi:ubiquinone/menaquinone biosynthesis C-methylase UbiE